MLDAWVLSKLAEDHSWNMLYRNIHIHTEAKIQPITLSMERCTVYIITIYTLIFKYNTHFGVKYVYVMLGC